MLECEFKVSLEEVAARRLAAGLGRPAETIYQENHYIGDRVGHLATAHYGLRLRRTLPLPSDLPFDLTAGILRDPARLRSATKLEDPSTWILTLKGPARKEGALYQRSEIECAVEPPEQWNAGRSPRAGTDLQTAWPDAWPTAWPAAWPAAWLAAWLAADATRWPPVAAAAARGFDPATAEILGSTRTIRRRYRFPEPPADILCFLELDITLYPDDSLGFELEAEIARDSTCAGAGVIEEELRLLLQRQAIPWRPSVQGKYTRFLASRQR